MPVGQVKKRKTLTFEEIIFRLIRLTWISSVYLLIARNGGYRSPSHQ